MIFRGSWPSDTPHTLFGSAHVFDKLYLSHIKYLCSNIYFTIFSYWSHISWMSYRSCRDTGSDLEPLVYIKKAFLLAKAIFSIPRIMFCIVWFDSLCSSQQFYSYVGTGFLGWPVLSKDNCVLLKDTTQWRQWGSTLQSRVKHSTIEPLCSPQNNVVDH